jgi:hypothetical protein
MLQLLLRLQAISSAAAAATAAAAAAAAAACVLPAQLSSLFFLMTSAYQLALILGMRSSVCTSKQQQQAG